MHGRITFAVDDTQVIGLAELEYDLENFFVIRHSHAANGRSGMQPARKGCSGTRHVRRALGEQAREEARINETEQLLDFFQAFVLPVNVVEDRVDNIRPSIVACSLVSASFQKNLNHLNTMQGESKLQRRHTARRTVLKGLRMGVT